ncbi:NAD(P)-dependent dehydrogenase, short-chain alcohol dehydrogenase family [Pustulibacterium marinum]|uniref:NAD(P)-dependent dehydrogenase, short-chain alcohol dehydrogenase family n=1 Tax=Pustulibacterium marinum TaxID=1224947 RepID=A0A1I7H4J9_9FLAO|nr:SDR family oxidoreductase [Pustulibacterium marinum]SFU55639.1 NAD(P)-dependent dehydrogenase, short-chain alcohol dehydrogenase family [Pustulibacterium marinum]
MRKILVIGGSRGIGKAVVEGLVKDHEVISFSRTEGNLPESVQQYELDILKDELPDIESLDGLVYCPGSINLKPIASLKITDFREDFEINVIGIVRCIQKYTKILKKGNNPSVVCFSTVATQLGMPYHASIAASKAAVEGLVKTLAAEFAPLIRVNAVAPTVTKTDLAERLFRSDSMKEKLKERHPLQNYLQPEDVASVVHFLLSNASKSITGSILPVDNGIVSVKL